MIALPGSLTAARAVAWGALVVGSLDALDAIVFFGLRGVQPLRIFQSIASGLLGRAAFQGGAATAALGIALHFFIAAGIVVTFYLASRRLRWLLQHPVIIGLLYGLVVYAVMNYVVLPLSAAGRGSVSTPVFVNGLLIHAFGVGLPTALFVRAAPAPPAAR
jgi:asparagine N-glycosylation enzyme membrane subunit Stt3